MWYTGTVIVIVLSVSQILLMDPRAGVLNVEEKWLLANILDGNLARQREADKCKNSHDSSLHSCVVSTQREQSLLPMYSAL